MLLYSTSSRNDNNIIYCIYRVQSRDQSSLGESDSPNQLTSRRQKHHTVTSKQIRECRSICMAIQFAQAFIVDIIKCILCFHK